MKMISPLRRLFAGTLFLLIGFDAAGATLGRAQGVALIGRPLDLRVQLGLDAGADPSSVCLEADVFHADTRVDPSHVAVRLESVSGLSATASVRSSLLIDEPVVTVYLRMGCGQKVTRRYVLLAEPVPEGAGESAPPRVPVPVPLPQVPARPAAAAVPLKAARSLQTPPQAQATAPSRARAPARPTPIERQRARLKLDPLDLSLEREPSLKATTSLGNQTETTPQRRAEAAALWQALNAQPEDMLRNAQLVRALEGDIKELRDAVHKNNAGLTELRGQLESARAERYANTLVYALLALVLAACAVAAYAWRRSERPGGSGRDWWRGRQSLSNSDFGADSMPAAALKTSPVAVQRPAVPDSQVDLDLSFSESALDRLHDEAVPALAQRTLNEFDFHMSQPGSLRAVKAEELSDVQQQADFFVSLGEYTRAIEILRSHISAHPDTSALAWLDLLDLYHKLNRPNDYEWVRDEFNRVFNGQVPFFDAYSEQSQGLEAYQDALSRIEALWPSPKVLDIIEESLFRRPGSAGGEAFGLEAYRELLLLHNVCKDLLQSDEGFADFQPSSSSPHSDFSNTSIQPLSVARSAANDFSRIGLDIDLDQPPAPSPEFVSIGWEEVRPPAPSNLLDFDLPEIDTQVFKPKKPG